MSHFANSDQDEFELQPPEWHEHLMKSLLHQAGRGPHPGLYQGPGPRAREPGELTENDLARQRMLEQGPAREAQQPQGPMPPSESVQQPPQQGKGGRPPAQPHGVTPAATGAAAVKPEAPEGNF